MDTNRYNKRKKVFDSLNIKFNNKILIIGCGSIGSILIPTILKVVAINPNKITVIDKNEERLKHAKKIGVNTVNIKITLENAKKTIVDELKFGQDDIIIDASYEINTTYMFELCSEYGISYQNSSLELWEKEPRMKESDFVFYKLFKSLDDLHEKIKIKRNNFIISLGCNPGNVNLWTLYALDKINHDRSKKGLTVFSYDSYADLAEKLGLMVVHISEKDTQITNNPKKNMEYLNTWSRDNASIYEEVFGTLEISWGTHETKIPNHVNQTLSNEYQLILDKQASDSYAYTYTPISKNIIGMLVRHEESYTICKKLTKRDSSGKIIYKPSCYYIYRPCDSCMNSIYEYKENYFTPQPNKRLMTSDIIEGRDEIGCTLFFSNGDIYWVGSLLDINETRNLYDNKHNNYINPTILQVVAGYVGGLYYLIEQINKKEYKGLLLPEDLPIKKTIDITKCLLGPFGLIKVEDWTIIQTPDKLWQFESFTY